MRGTMPCVYNHALKLPGTVDLSTVDSQASTFLIVAFDCWLILCLYIYLLGLQSHKYFWKHDYFGYKSGLQPGHPEGT